MRYAPINKIKLTLSALIALAMSFFRKKSTQFVKAYIPTITKRKVAAYITLSKKFKRLKKSTKESVGYPSSLFNFS